MNNHHLVGVDNFDDDFDDDFDDFDDAAGEKMGLFRNNCL
jgi:hypothetical protein